MNDQAFIVIIIFLIGSFITFYFGDFYERKFSIKSSRIQTAILGTLERAITELIETYRDGNPINIQEHEYANFITHFRDSGFTKHINNYERLLDYERTSEETTNKIAFCLISFIVPLTLFYFNIYQEMYIFLFYILSIYLFSKIIEYWRMASHISMLYKEYVLSQRSFGGYDE